MRLAVLLLVAALHGTALWAAWTSAPPRMSLDPRASQAVSWVELQPRPRPASEVTSPRPDQPPVRENPEAAMEPPVTESPKPPEDTPVAESPEPAQERRATRNPEPPENTPVAENPKAGEAVPATKLAVAEQVAPPREETVTENPVVDDPEPPAQAPARPSQANALAAPEETPVAEAPAVVPPRFDAAYLSNPPPKYPARSRRLGEQGRVILHVQVTVAGRPAEIEIRRSSGFKRLDEVAVDTVRRWKFVPARQGEMPIEASVLVPISFTLSRG